MSTFLKPPDDEDRRRNSTSSNESDGWTEWRVRDIPRDPFTPVQHLLRLLGSTASWSALSALCGAVLNRFSAAYRSLPAEEQHRVRLLVLSLGNAGVTGGWAIRYHCLRLRDDDVRLVSEIRSLTSFFCGYVLHDLVSMVMSPPFAAADVIHHSLALVLTYGVILGVRKCAVWHSLPNYLMMELSTVPLDLLLILKALGLPEQSALFRRLSYAFVALFFATRVVGLPAHLLNLYRDGTMQMYGALKYGLILATALQFYWFAMILRKLRGG